MTLKLHTPDGVFPPYRSYSHAVEVPPGARTLYLSGLNGYENDGRTMPETFTAQGNLIWRHMGTILRAAGMDYGDLVFVRTYLVDPADDEANVALRVKYLGTHRPALTVVACPLLVPAWKLEVEAIAAKVQG